MRATSISLLAVLVLACQSQPCSAQTTPPNKTQPTSGTPNKSDDLLSPSTLPKDRQKVTEAPGTDRVDALSPDEARRAARARARAAAKGGAAHTADEPRAPSPAAGTMIRKRVRAAEAKHDRRPPVVKHASVVPARPPRHASRAVAPFQGSRTVAESNVRYGRPRALPARRALAQDQGQTPRVGDVIPAGIPLFPLPPADDPRQAYAPGPPPFPRFQDDQADDGSAPRRVNGGPY